MAQIVSIAYLAPFLEACPYRIQEIPGTSVYFAATNGMIFSLRGKVRRVKGTICGNGYRYTTIKNAKDMTHALIAKTFIGPRPEGMDVCHNDGNKNNNRLNNLRYGTKKENAADSIRHGIIVKGVKNPNARLTEEDVINIRRLGEVMPIASIADYCGIARGHCRKIITRDLWPHLMD